MHKKSKMSMKYGKWGETISHNNQTTSTIKQYLNKMRGKKKGKEVLPLEVLALRFNWHK